MMSLLLLGLATWRVSSMLVQEDGPWFIFRRLRDRMGFVHTEDGQVLAKPDGNVLGCLWCTSVFVSCVLSVIPFPVLMILAGSTIAIWLDRRV